MAEKHFFKVYSHLIENYALKNNDFNDRIAINNEIITRRSEFETLLYARFNEISVKRGFTPNDFYKYVSVLVNCGVSPWYAVFTEKERVDIFNVIIIYEWLLISGDYSLVTRIRKTGDINV